MVTFGRVLTAALLALFAASVVAQGKTEVVWLGHAAFRITTPGGKVIVTDPWVTSNPKTPPEWKNLDALGRVDLILVTHAPVDHVADAPALAKRQNAPVWGPAGLALTLSTLGVLPTELAPQFGKGGTITPFGPNGPKITATHAEHSSELLWRNPVTGKSEIHPGGEPVGFIIEMENGFKIYHMGDTALFGDMKLIGERYKPDLALVPIGGNFTMDPADAAWAVKELLKPKTVIPMHYGTNPLAKGTAKEFSEAMGTGSSVRVIVAVPGQALKF